MYLFISIYLFISNYLFISIYLFISHYLFIYLYIWLYLSEWRWWLSGDCTVRLNVVFIFQPYQQFNTLLFWLSSHPYNIKHLLLFEFIFLSITYVRHIPHPVPNVNLYPPPYPSLIHSSLPHTPSTSNILIHLFI